MALPPGGEVIQASVAGRELVLLGRAPQGQFVLVVELASGERRRLVWLAPGAVSRASTRSSSRAGCRRGRHRRSGRPAGLRAGGLARRALAGSAGGCRRPGGAARMPRAVPRAEPPCRHFGRCGGCRLQHLTTADYAAFKRQRIVDALARQGLPTDCVAEVRIGPPASRRRLRLAVKRGRSRVWLGLRERSGHGWCRSRCAPSPSPRWWPCWRRSARRSPPG